MGRRTLPAPDPALISNGSLRRKFNACNESASVIRLFIRENVRMMLPQHVAGVELLAHAEPRCKPAAPVATIAAASAAGMWRRWSPVEVYELVPGRKLTRLLIPVADNLKGVRSTGGWAAFFTGRLPA